jgi:hypothetical protein
MRLARFESTPYRAAAGEVRRRLRIAFLWKGPGDTRPRRYRESTRLDDNRANRRMWTPNLRQIEREFIVGSFDPLRWFPWSRSNEKSFAARALMLGAGKPIQWIAHQLGHVGVKKIDEVYGRWSNPPEEERLELETLFAAVGSLPRQTVARPNLPKFCPSEDALLGGDYETPDFTGTYGSVGAPAGNRTRT